MSGPIKWDDPTWLFVPESTVVDDVWDVTLTIGSDYQEDHAVRLFATIEYRLAQSVAHFDDISYDDRLVASVRSELNFLRAVWGEIRHARGICPPASPFLRLLQHCVDRKTWVRMDDLRRLAAVQAATKPAHPLLEPQQFGVRQWWLELPNQACRLPKEWRAFDMADAIMELGLQHVDATDIQTFTGDLHTLASDLTALQDEIKASEDRLSTLEQAVAARIAQSLQSPI